MKLGTVVLCDANPGGVELRRFNTVEVPDPDDVPEHAAEGAEAVVLKGWRPAVALPVVREVRRRGSKGTIVVLTRHADAAAGQQAIRLGAQFIGECDLGRLEAVLIAAVAARKQPRKGGGKRRAQ